MANILKGTAAVYNLQCSQSEKDTKDLLKSLNGDALLELLARDKRAQ